MKKVLLLLILSILFIPGSVLAADTDLNVSRVPFKVVINEQKIVGDDEYPLLFYKDIVYLPTTFNMNSFVGLRVEFYPDYKIADKKIGSIFVGLDKITANNYVPYPSEEKIAKAAIQENVIVVNQWDKRYDIKNSEREYPVINYKNVLYLPLTCDIAIKELDWNLTFSPETGLEVDTKSPNKPIWDSNYSSIVGYNSSPKFFPPEYIYTQNEYAAYPASTFEGTEFRYKKVGQEEIKKAIPFHGADYYFNRKTTTGKDIIYDENDNAILEPGGILKMPAVKKTKINGEYIGVNIYLTVDVKNGEIIEIKEE